MAKNEALRALMASHGMSTDYVARQLGVDPKTAYRWIDEQSRIPHSQTRSRLCAMLGVDEARLWPQLADRQSAKGASEAEVVTLYPDRGQVPRSLWTTMVADARETVTLLVYAGLFWFDAHAEMRRLLMDRADAGVQVRLALGDPDSCAIELRGEEEGIDMAARTRISLGLVDPLVGYPGIEVRLHSTTLYASMYRADDTLLANTHVFGSAAADSPVLHVQHIPGARLFQHYADSFERIWFRARPYEAGSASRPH